LSDFNGTSTFLTEFQKSSNIKFHKNPSSGSWVVPCRQTGRHYEGKSHFAQFCKCT